jgi:hypothetical protein
MNIDNINLNILRSNQEEEFKAKLKEKYGNCTPEDLNHFLHNITWEEPYELIARKWKEYFEKAYDKQSIRLISEEIPDLQSFLKQNTGNTQQAFKERVKHLNLETKRWI